MKMHTLKKIERLNQFKGFCFCLVIILVWLIGFIQGLSVSHDMNKQPAKTSITSKNDSEYKCTCVPCLPDLYCHKCGHKSRDCPKLKDYFSNSTNATFKVQ